LTNIGEDIDNYIKYAIYIDVKFSTYNIFINISPIPTRVGSLDSPH